MPASIVTTLLLWSAMLLPGASAGSTRAVDGLPALGQWVSAAISVDEMATIQAWPLDTDDTWTISEADTEEEESDDGDGDRIVAESRWTSLKPADQGLASAIRHDRGAVRSSVRSPILRC